MKCADLMNRNLEWLGEKDTILAAATRMAETGVGFLPICDEQRRAIGVVTDRDLTIRALARRLDPETTSAAMVMTAPAITCLASANVRDAEELMALERKARLVITDDAGRVAGVLSLADLIERGKKQPAFDTVRLVMWREALGPRGGAAPGQPLLKDDPIARNQPAAPEDATARQTVFTGGHRSNDTREFPT